MFDELEKHYLQLVDGLLVPAPVDGVFQADDLIQQQVREDLLKGIAVLENVDDSKKDWHPGSNEQVLDLVHPSLFPFIRNVTRVTDGKRLPWKEFLGSGAVEKVAGPNEVDEGHLPPCRQGAECLARYPSHFAKFSHPPSVYGTSLILLKFHADA